MPLTVTTTKQIAEKIVRRESKEQVFPDNDAFVDRVIEVKVLLDSIARRASLDPNFLTRHEPESVETAYDGLHAAKVRA